MSTGYLVCDTIGRRVFRQVRATVSQVGPVITAATAETATAGNTGAAGPRACQFRGSNDIYCNIRGEIFRYNQGTDDWDSVYTPVTLPVSTLQQYHFGPVVMAINGTQTMVHGYYSTVAGLRLAKTTDGVSWSESALITMPNGSEAQWNLRISANRIIFLTRASSQTYYVAVDPTTDGASFFAFFTYSMDGSSKDYAASANFKGREFILAWNVNSTAPAMFEVNGGIPTLIFEFWNGGGSLNVNRDMKQCLFEANGKLIAFVFGYDAVSGDSTYGWHAFVMDTTGVAGALQEESEITDTVMPAAFGRNSGIAQDDNGWLPIIDYEANIGGEPEIGLLYRPNGAVSSSMSYYIWNGTGAVIGNSGAANDIGSDASFGFPYEPTGSGKYFWTLDNLDSTIDSVTPAFGGETFGITLYASPNRIAHGAVTSGPFEELESVSSSGGGTATIARGGVGSGFLLLDNVTGTFADTNTITQTTGTNTGANATQNGAMVDNTLSCEVFFNFAKSTDTAFTRATISASDVGTVNVGAKTVEGLTARSEGTVLNVTLDTVTDGISAGEFIDVRANVEII